MSRRHAVRSSRRQVRVIVEACESRRLLCAEHIAANLSGSSTAAPKEITPIVQDVSATKHNQGPQFLLSVPALSSNPPTLSDPRLSIYLDFDGQGDLSPFDLDSDPGTYSAGELATIQECWRQISEYFASFNVNVTTVQPSSSDNFLWDVVTGDAVQPGSIRVGDAIYNPHPTTPTSWEASISAVNQISVIAHEIGHGMGLAHLSTFTNAGELDSDYRTDANPTHQAIMGQDFSGIVAKWQSGQGNHDNTYYQDDVATIASTAALYGAIGGDGFKPDDYSGSLSSPTALTVGGSGAATGSGVIERLDDADVFSFTLSSATRARIEVNPTWPSGVDLRATLYNSTGDIVLGLDDPASLDQQTIASLPSGTYRLKIEGSGNVGDVGSYTVSVSPFADDWQTARLQPGRTGSVSYDASSGAFQLEGVGMSAVAANAADTEFVYRRLLGNGSIVGRVTMDASAKDGYLGFAMRTSLDPNSPKVQILLSTANLSGQFGVRDTTGASLTSITSGPHPSAGTAVWLKLERTGGDQISAYTSSDGTTWTQVGDTVSTDTDGIGNADLYIGMVASSDSLRLSNLHDVGRGTIDNVSLTGSLYGTASYGLGAAPTGVSSYPSAGTSSVITWNSVLGASYVIEYSPDGAQWAQVGTASSTTFSFTHDPGTGGKRQFYRVRSVFFGFLLCQASTAYSFVNAPAAVSSLQAQLVPTTGAESVLRWEDTFGESGYEISRSTNGGSSYTAIATVAANTVTYLDAAATGGVDTLYRIVPTGTSNGLPTYSNSIHVTLPKATTFTFTRNTATSGTLDWSAVSSAASYTLERSADSGSSWTTLSSTLTGLTYTDSARLDLVRYIYRLKAVDAASVAGVPAAADVFTADSSKAIASPWAISNDGDDPSAETGRAELDSGTFSLATTVKNLVSDQRISSTFVYQTLTGDGSITARLVSTPSNAISSPLYYAGIMIASDLTSNHARMAIGLTASALVYRDGIATDGGSRTHNFVAFANAPTYYRLTRASDVVTAEYWDGTTWVNGGSSTLALGSSAYVGLFVVSANTSLPLMSTKAIFENVTVYDPSPIMTTQLPGKSSGVKPTRRDDVWSELAIA
jgi:hypothetical protein